MYICIEQLGIAPQHQNKFIMRANLFIHKEVLEILLTNGTSFVPNKNEAKDVFIERVSTEVEAEYLEKIDLKEVDETSIKKVGSKQLLARLNNAKGVANDLIRYVLIKRGALATPVAPKEAPKGKKFKPEEEAPEVIEIDYTDYTKEELIDFVKALKARPVKTTKQKYTLDEVNEHTAAAKPNVGKKCSFVAYGSAERLAGTINGVWVDKRVPMALYRIRLEDGSMKNKIVLTNEIEIFEPTAEELAAKAKPAEKKAKKVAKVEEKPTVAEVDAEWEPTDMKTTIITKEA